MDSSESGMNPVAIIIINPWKNIGRAVDRNQWPPLLKSYMLLYAKENNYAKLFR